MVSKILVALCVVITVACAVPALPAAPGWGPQAGGVSPYMPAWLATAPWMPKWVPCIGTGSSCLDCETRVVCTKIGGLVRVCDDPTLPHCNNGTCSATPSANCIVPAVPVIPV